MRLKTGWNQKSLKYHFRDQTSVFVCFSLIGFVYFPDNFLCGFECFMFWPTFQAVFGFWSFQFFTKEWKSTESCLSNAITVSITSAFIVLKNLLSFHADVTDIKISITLWHNDNMNFDKQKQTWCSQMTFKDYLT